VDETRLEGYNPVNAIRPEDAELALIIATKIDQTTATLAGAGQCHLVDRSGALPVFIFEQHEGLTRHRCRQAKIREFNHLAGDWWLRRRNWRLRHWVHSTIEAEAMYLLK
jgi:hypothetical protein